MGSVCPFAYSRAFFHVFCFAQSRLRADLVLARNSNKFLVVQNKQLSNELHAEIAALKAQVDESGAIAQKKEKLVSTIRDAIGEQQSALNECFAHVRHTKHEHEHVVDECLVRDDFADASAGIAADAQVGLLASPRSSRSPISRYSRSPPSSQRAFADSSAGAELTGKSWAWGHHTRRSFLGSTSAHISCSPLTWFLAPIVFSGAGCAWSTKSPAPHMATRSMHSRGSNRTSPRFLSDTTSSWNKRRNQVNAPAF